MKKTMMTTMNLNTAVGTYHNNDMFGFVRPNFDNMTVEPVKLYALRLEDTVHRRYCS